MQDMTQYNVNYLKTLFKNYYSSNFVSSPIAIESREVGIGELGKKISARHLSFKNLDELNAFLRTTAPFFVSYSVGYYRHPGMRPMEKKEMFASDIVYEFDADDFSLPCMNEHDVWYCSNCQASGTGHKDICPNCQGKTEITEWVCDKCLGHAKSETLRLMDFLEDSFKLDPNTFFVSFSGSKGYHIRVTDKLIQHLSKSSRLQMTNYIQGKDIELEKLGFIFKDRQWYCPPKNSLGLSGKLLLFLKNYITTMTEAGLIKDLRLTKLKARKVISNKEVILNKMDNNILWHGFSKDAKSDAKFWEDLLNLAISKICFRIDASSSMDIYKLMRMPDTLHGGTGLLSCHIKSREDLKSFEPLCDAVVFREDISRKIEVTRPVPKFSLMGQSFGPFEVSQTAELPEAVCVYLLLKGVVK